MAKETAISNVSNDARSDIESRTPYLVKAKIVGVADFLFHRYSVEAVEEKSKAKKGSKEKKSDNVESYVYRDSFGLLCIPGEYVRQSIIRAAKSKQDPRSPRKSAMDLYTAGVVAMTDLAPIGEGVKEWEYMDRRRVIVNGSAIPRERPAMRAGWSVSVDLQVLTPEYINVDDLHDVLVQAGRLVGIGDFRPTFGRFRVESFKRIELQESQAAE